MLKKAVLYLRVSSQSQVDNFSLASQGAICKEYCAKSNYDIVKIFTEPGESAKTDDRPEFQKMLMFCRAKENNINAVVFYHSSRFSRDTKDLLNIQADLARFAISLDSVTEPMIKEMSPESRLYTTIVSGFNQYENENRARNTANGMKRRFFEGYPISFPPLGYRLIKRPGEKSQAIRDEQWWPIIKNIWERTANEMLTLRAVVRELNKYKLRKFSKTAVHAILHNHFYYGLLQSRKYGTTQGRHEPMITKDLYYRVQAVLAGKNTTSCPKTHFRQDFMLRGILICPECGRKLSSCWSKGKRHLFPYYLCSGRTHKFKNIPRDLIENKFLELLKSLEPTKEYLELRVAIMLEKYEAQNKVILETKGMVQKAIDNLEGMLAVLKEKHLKKIYNDTDFLAMRDDLETKIMAKRSLLAEKSIDIDEIKLLTNWIKAFFAHLEKIFVAAPPEARQTLGCSIFPNGVIFENGNFRTPEIAGSFRLKEAFTASSFNSVTPSGFGPELQG